MPEVANPVSFNCPLSVPSLFSGLLLMVQRWIQHLEVKCSSPRPCMRKRTLSAYRLGDLADNTLKTICNHDAMVSNGSYKDKVA